MNQAPTPTPPPASAHPALPHAPVDAAPVADDAANAANAANAAAAGEVNGAAAPAVADAAAVDNGAGGPAMDESVIVFTDNAARKVKTLLDEEGNPELKLRVFISGGGCSGFQYGFTFDDEQADDDTVLKKMGVTVVIDPMSLQYLVGAEIDYKEGFQGSQFVIRNPNVTSTCGCGSSFAV